MNCIMEMMTDEDIKVFDKEKLNMNNNGHVLVTSTTKPTLL